jgi:hypothetical protein
MLKEVYVLPTFNIFTYMCVTIDGVRLNGLIYWQLTGRTTNNYNPMAVSTLNSSLQHPLSLATASNSGYSSDSRAHELLSQPPVQNSPQFRQLLTANSGTRL